MENPTGKLSLRFRKRTDGRSYLAGQYYKLPLQIMPPHYQDNDGTVFAYMLNMSGGILQHDRLLTEILTEEESRALVTTPADTKIYKMDDGIAVAENRIELRKGSVLEYLPECNIPFAGSKYYQKTVFDLNKESTLIAFDMTVPGRVSRGELFEYDIFDSKTEIRLDGKILAYDSSHIEPGKMKITAPGLLDGNSAFGSIYVYDDNLSGDIAEIISRFYLGKEDAADEDPKGNGDISGNVRVGATMITDTLMIARLLSENSLDMKKAMLDIWDIIRKKILKKPAVRIRKY